MELRQRGFTGTTSNRPTLRELEHGLLARRAAAEGYVLLKNQDNLLPIAKGSKLGLYGAGAAYTVKGGTGSGDVNERESVSIYQGLLQAGYCITSTQWLADYTLCYQTARQHWKEAIEQKMQQEKKSFTFAYFETPFRTPAGNPLSPTAAEDGAQTAIYVLSRIAGEGADRKNEPGDYRISPQELSLLEQISTCYSSVVLVINTGGMVDLSFVDRLPNIKAILQIMQPGQEGGNAFADILSGDVTPSGKLADSWAFTYEDYPAFYTRHQLQNGIRREEYREGIYVGYRYFDTFQIPVRYGFGFGLSYTRFSIHLQQFSLDDTDPSQPQLRLTVAVRNIGQQYSGKEVVQVYVSCPQGKLHKEFRRLAAFAKTETLLPRQQQLLSLSIPLYQLCSYHTEQSAWMLEQGMYGIWLGNSLQESSLVAAFTLDATAIFVQCSAACSPQNIYPEISPKQTLLQQRQQLWQQQVTAQNLPCISLAAQNLPTKVVDAQPPVTEFSGRAAEILEQLSPEQMMHLVVGSLDGENTDLLGAAGVHVPGAAAETTGQFRGEPWNLAGIVLADGPAGLRLRQEYQVQDGKIVKEDFPGELERSFFAEPTPQVGTCYYQYCTAIPVGTLLAQTWNLPLVESVGYMMGKEMQLFEVSLWLAPGMNIHRNPLGGRNFEYYSEDCLLTGYMAAAMTQGVQSVPGCGTTIKHFACNNQEDGRLLSDSAVSERALREIYLKGFEIAITQSQPMAVMTSYNQVNGVYAANNADLCTKIARCEWGFSGIFMTDWASTVSTPPGTCDAAGCIRAGNDLIMPGCKQDIASIQTGLETETISLQQLRLCAYRIIRTILQSNQYVQELPPLSQDFLKKSKP